MGLKADIEEVSRVWKSAPWRVKIFLGLALFLSTSSIASLSEAIFKWKGFALDALTFYRTYLVEPLGIQLTRLIGYALPQHFFDIAVIYTVFFSGLIRIAIFRSRSLASKAGDIFTFIVCYVGMIYLSLAPTADTTNSTANNNVVWFSYPLFLLWFYVATKGAERILAMSHMLAPILGVAILGAISAGLSR